MAGMEKDKRISLRIPLTLLARVETTRKIWAQNTEGAVFPESVVLRRLIEIGLDVIEQEQPKTRGIKK